MLGKEKCANQLLHSKYTTNCNYEYCTFFQVHTKDRQFNKASKHSLLFFSFKTYDVGRYQEEFTNGYSAAYRDRIIKEIIEYHKFIKCKQ